MLRHWTNELFAAAALLFLASTNTGCSRSAEGTGLSSKAPAAVQAAEKNKIETLLVMPRPQLFEELDRAAVFFDHGRHTKALKKEGCLVCHNADAKGRVTYEFARFEGRLNRKSLTDSYHAACMKCHGGAAPEGVRSRSLSCGECHNDRLRHQPVQWYKAVFDHFHHISEMEKGCDKCHHAYDEHQCKLVYIRGQETACGKCHKDTDEGNSESLRKAGHKSCIGCHEKLFLGGETKMEPYSCRECHKPEANVKPVETTTLVARTFEKKPKDLLISSPGAILPPVPFNHEKHDKDSTCSKACHHFHVRTLVGIDTHFAKTGDACRQCHKNGDVPARADVLNADRTYHEPDSEHTCVGCHKQKNKQAGKAQAKAPVTCKECHKGQPATPQLAALQVAISLEKGPETSVIASLSKKYLPVKFPHQQHTKMIESCDTCHHYGPKKEMPACNTCHGSTLNFTRLAKPRLISAYHRMCLGCHRNMGVGPVGCTKCHEEKETVFPAGLRLETAQSLNGQVNSVAH
ncbi:hypothetical protein HZA56_09610 [Candidatus Poribacteria bacterium]|nr:hypothetical protein [Candidatus Poribacteria bacterium]